MRARSTTREVEDLLLDLTGLVHVRALLERRGASSEEIAEHTTAIERLRDRLAELVKQEGEPAAA